MGLHGNKGWDSLCSRSTINIVYQTELWGLPGGPVVRTSQAIAQDMGSIPCQRTQIMEAADQPKEPPEATKPELPAHMRDINNKNAL